MSIVQTADRVHESEAAIPMDAGFWSKIAAQQSEDDARKTESIAEVNKPYRLSPPMTDKQRIETPVFTTIKSVKDELAVWRVKGGFYPNEVARLLDQAEREHVEYGEVMMLQIRCYRTGGWILFNPPEASMRSMEGWYSFFREELNWAGSIHWLVDAPSELLILKRIERTEAKLVRLKASIAARRAAARAFRQAAEPRG